MVQRQHCGFLFQMSQCLLWLTFITDAEEQKHQNHSTFLLSRLSDSRLHPPGCWIGISNLMSGTSVLFPVFPNKPTNKYLFLSLFTIAADDTIIQNHLPTKLVTSLLPYFLSCFIFKPSVNPVGPAHDRDVPNPATPHQVQCSLSKSHPIPSHLFESSEIGSWSLSYHPYPL